MPIRTLRGVAATTAPAVMAALMGAIAPSPAMAQDLYIGQIILGGWNFCPRGTMATEGQLLPISQNQALFALLGTNFGGNGTSTFGLPDLRARAAVGTGQAPGQSPVTLGQAGGQDSVTLTVAQMPTHTHHVTGTATGAMRAAAGPATATSAGGNALSNAAAGTYTAIGQPGTAMRAGSVEVDIDIDTAPTGGGQPFDNRSPYLGLTYCIATQGIFPSRD